MHAPRSARPSLGVVAAVVIAVVVLAVLGAMGLTDKSLSLDEIATLRYASLPGRRLVDLVIREQANMSAYYAAMWPWVRLADTEPWLRLPSLAAAVASVPVLFHVGRRLVGSEAAAVAAVLFALSAFVLEFALTARSYSMATLAVLLATWAYLEARARPTRWRLAGYVLAVAAATYLHFLCGLIVLAHIVHFLVSGSLAQDGRRWAWVGAGLLVACGPLVVLLALQDAGQVDWIPALSAEHVAGVVVAWLGVSTPAALALGAALLAGAVVAVRVRTAESLLVLTWSVVPIAALIVISLVKPLLISRYLLFTVPAVCLLAGLALASMPRVPRIVAMVLLVAVSATGVAAWYARPAPEWRELAAFMVRLRGATDIALYDVAYSQPAVEYYARQIDGDLPAPVTWDELALHPRRDLWVVVHLRDPAERQAIEARLAGTWELFRSYGFEGVSLRRYVPNGEGVE
jgi:mannosyltransferase